LNLELIMALHTISNNCLVVTVSDHGAELQSIKSSDGIEYLWQGDPEFWGRRSPILFPFVGAEVNDTYRFNGKEYHMPQHGFARDREFTFVEKEGSKISFVLESDDETREIYPFDFALTVEYSLFNNELHVKWTVENKTDGVMYYAIGAHPAFNLPETVEREDCLIMLDKMPHTLTTISGRYADEEVGVKNSLHIQPNRMIHIEKDLFKNDALVFENGQVHSVALCDDGGDPFVEVTFDAPVVGIWSPYKEGCPFVCIEPWYGRCDHVGFDGDLSEKEWMNTLEVGESAVHQYMITIE